MAKLTKAEILAELVDEATEIEEARQARKEKRQQKFKPIREFAPIGNRKDNKRKLRNIRRALQRGDLDPSKYGRKEDDKSSRID
jgi:hypothetical protein